jgi:hypothetical protein
MRKAYRILLIVVLGIGVLAAIYVEDLLDALHRQQNQVRKPDDIRAMGGAWFSWQLDRLESPEDTPADWTSVFESIGYEVELVSSNQDYRVYRTHKLDKWGHPYEITEFADSLDGPLLQIRSFGADGKEGPAGPPYPLGPFVATAYGEDIVWVDGFYVRYPAGAQVD